MKQGSRSVKLKSGMKIDTGNGYLYEYTENDLFVEFELVNRNIDGVDHQVTLHTGNIYTVDELNEKYE